MKTINNYQIELEPFGLQLPIPSKVIGAGIQGDKNVMWVETTTDTAVFKMFHFQVFATGQYIPGSAIHQATWQDGKFVWHLYQLVK